jgi:hypothetical protein
MPLVGATADRGLVCPFSLTFRKQPFAVVQGGRPYIVR